MEENKTALMLIFPNIKFIKGTTIAVYAEKSDSIADYKYHVISTITGNTMDYFYANAMRQAGEWVWFTSYYCDDSNHILFNAKTMDRYEFGCSISYRRMGNFQIWYDYGTVILNGPAGMYRYEGFIKATEIDGVIPLSIQLKDRTVNFGKDGWPMGAETIINKYADLHGGFKEIWRTDAGEDRCYYVALSNDNIQCIYDSTGTPVERNIRRVAKAKFDKYIASIYNDKTRLVLKDGKIPA